MATMNSTYYKDLTAALQYLDRVCDGANSEDGAGFNGVDTKFGKSLARQSHDKILSDKQQKAAIKMLQKYRKQLEAVGIELPTQKDYEEHLATLTTKKSDNIKILKASLDTNDFGKECIGLTFLPDCFDRPTLALIKEIPGRFYKKEKTTWWIPVEQWETALQKIGTKRFQIDAALESKYGSGTADYQPENIPESPVDLSSIELEGIDVPGLNGTPFQFQREGIEFLDLANGKAILGDEMGLGKGQPADTPILTPTGWTTYGEIKTGDYVVGSNGNPTKVIGVYPKPQQPVYRISFNDKTSTIVDGDHLWQIKTGNGSDLVLSTNEMLEHNTKIRKSERRDYTYDTYYLSADGQARYKVPIVMPVNFEQHSKIEVDPYLFGIWLGDGGKNILHLSKDDSKDILSNIKFSDENVVHLPEDRGILSIRINGKFIDFLKHRAMFNLKSYEKFIPPEFLYTSIPNRLRLLQGLMDTDGYAMPNGGAEFCTTSKTLLDGVVELTQSLGGIARVGKIKENPQYSYNDEIKHGRTAYRVNIKLPSNMNPFLCDRKVNRYVVPTKYPPARRITNIEYAGEMETICIAVDAPDHLYVTEHYIVTHNTIQAIGYMQLHPELRHALVVCPASLKLNWQNEINKWLTDNKTVHVIDGRTPYKLPMAHIYIINYDILEAWAETLIAKNIKLAIFDEAHAMKNITAKRTKAGMTVGQSIEYTILMTGTPILNRPVELYPLLKIVQPNEWGTYSAFTQRYCAAQRRSIVTPKGHYRTWMDVSGASNLDELSVRIKPLMLRRLKKDVLTDLPEKMRSVVPININMRDYDRFTIETKNQIEQRNLKGGEALVLIEKLKQYVAEQKLIASIDWIESFIESEKLVLFCTHREIADQIIKKFKKECVFIHGGVSKSERQDAVDRFQNDESVRLFVGTIQSCGEGITLTAASNVAILELLWNPGRHLQAEDRVHRIGQKYPVNTWYLLAQNTIDNVIFDAMHGKQSIINQVLDEQNIESSFDESELKTVALDYIMSYGE